MKSRNDMLNYLHNIPVGAQATVATIDVGLEYEYVTKEGYGTSLGNMGDWPVHVVHNVSQEKLKTIKQKISEGNLQQDDLKGTGLEGFYHYVFAVERPKEYVPTLSNFFKEINYLDNIIDNSIYIMCDGREWEPEVQFYRTYSDISDAFTEKYVVNIEPWDDLSDEELEEWITKIQQELSSITINDFGCKAF